MFVQGSVMIEAPTKDELWSIFEKGSENRHVSSTSEITINAVEFVPNLSLAY